MTTFEEHCIMVGVDPVILKFGVTPDVYNELRSIAMSNDTNIEDLLRDIIDDFLLNTPE